MDQPIVIEQQITVTQGSGGYGKTIVFNPEDYYLSSQNGVLVIRDKKTGNIQAGDLSLFLGCTLNRS